MELKGTSIIGFNRGSSGNKTLTGFNPATGVALAPTFYAANAAEVDQAARLAHQAFKSFSRTSGKTRAKFLRQIATNIEALGDVLVQRATQETGLPEGRIQSERGRTCNQLRLFADMIEEGSWVDARIDHPDPDRKPIPKPDVRSLLRPLGPVVVFGASNFPLAFSVAGGDTASALAGGNTVIVKAHHAHPGTSELVGSAVLDAVQSCDLPEGVFSLIYGSGNEVGTALVKHPLVKGGGFTGSRAGGRALFDAASSRPEPIPFYAEMSSVNPVVILPDALSERSDQLVAGLSGSVTLGAGQFCTNPGLIFLADSPESRSFVEKLGALMSASPEQTMLTDGISSTYRKSVAARSGHAAIKTIGTAGQQSTGCGAKTALFLTNAKEFLANPELSEEVFGPSTLVIMYSNRQELLALIDQLEGQLTATIHANDQDLNSGSELLAALEAKVGRLVFNGFPTGVEVCHAMVHGGPYPATSDGRSTSVGTRAIFRFTRQVCYQDLPDATLPDELKEGNPLSISRLVDGQITRN
jgi:NADP-dependent aldehyde dehydrogenase